jgi:hypothetical protein
MWKAAACDRYFKSILSPWGIKAYQFSSVSQEFFLPPNWGNVSKVKWLAEPPGGQ